MSFRKFFGIGQQYDPNEGVDVIQAPFSTALSKDAKSRLNAHYEAERARRELDRAMVNAGLNPMSAMQSVQSPVQQPGFAKRESYPLLFRLAVRLNVVTGFGMSEGPINTDNFTVHNAVQASPEVVAVFVTAGGKALILEDEAVLYPSDELIAKFNLLR